MTPAIVTERLFVVAVLAVLIGLAGSGTSEACSVCIDPSAESRKAFGITALILSLLPMLLVAGMVLFIRRAARRR